MKIKKLEVGNLLTNCYVLKDKNNAVIIDPGAEPEIIHKEVSGLNVKYILLTHGHFDHILGIKQLKKSLPSAKIVLHKKDLEQYEQLSGQLSYFLGQKENITLPRPDLLLEHEIKLAFADSFIKILQTPGHSAGSVTYIYKNSAFVGDLVFKDGFLGRTDLPDGNDSEIKNSLKEILELPDTTTIYPGHGESFSILELKK